MIIGTAGHVDHGKSALVTALTGRVMDRLAEERRRGITIDLNFAPLVLPSGIIAGVIDVPGHEDLVRTMAAGAGGIDIAVLVVAADEGIMPQTEEHLLVLEQLGIGAGIAVVTRADLAEPAMVEMVREDVESRLKASPIRWGSVMATSARTGHGIAELLDRIDAVAPSLARPAGDDLFRLPVDRAFTVPGVGTVVTGSIWSGTVSRGDALVLMPDGRELRVRSIESFGQPLDVAPARSRVALGVTGISAAEARRGAVLVHPDKGWLASARLDVALDLRRAVTRRTRVTIIHGTAQVGGWLAPRRGTPGAASLSLDRPVTARGGDRFIVRMPSPLRTIGGGRVLDPDAAGRRPWLAGLMAPDTEARLVPLVSRRRSGVPVRGLPVLLGCPPSDVPGLLSTQASLRVVGDLVISTARLTSMGEVIQRTVDRFHRDFPTRPGIPTETLRQQVQGDPAVVASQLAALEADCLLVRDGAVMRRPDFTPLLPGGDAAVAQLVEEIAGAGLTPPRLGELEVEGSTDVGGLVRRAVADGLLVLVEPDRAWSMVALDRFTSALEELDAAGDITIAAVRGRTGLSRQYLIPLLEWADRTGLTRREGDHRHWCGRRPRAANRPA